MGKLFKKIDFKVWVFLSFLAIHIVFLNINAAEWGDSYKILRSAQFIRHLTYPVDEKRPPLFSFFLSIIPSSLDQIFWGRVEMLIFSLVSFLVFYNLFELLSKEHDLAIKPALILFILNPVYLYWSLRVMSDIPFSLLVLLVFYFVSIWKDNYSFGKLMLIGLLIGLAVMMRFEGYILFGAVFLGFVFNKFRFSFLKSIRNLIYLTLGFSISISPYLYFRNPFKSSYLDEPSGRTYDLKIFLIYLSSLLFLFGFSYAFFFLIRKKNVVKEYFIQNSGITFFILFELLLVLVWPAAIPRLFVSIIPLLIIPLAWAIYEYFNEKKSKYLGFQVIPFGLLLFLYIVSQFFLKLQFLVLVRSVFILVILLQLLMAYTIIRRTSKGFYFLLVIILLIWSFSTIWIHKDIFRSINSASIFIKNNLKGEVVHNDVSYVSSWYLKQNGTYFSKIEKDSTSFEDYLNTGASYVLVTNEHNTDLSFDIEKRPYLTLLKDFEYKVNGKVFFSRIYKLKR